MRPTCALSYAARVGFRSNDSDPRHAPGESARVRPLLRPAVWSQGRCLVAAHCPHTAFLAGTLLFSRGDIDRRALQSAPPPSATGVREAPPKTRKEVIRSSGKTRAQHEALPGHRRIGRGSCRSTGVDGVGTPVHSSGTRFTPVSYTHLTLPTKA